MVDTYGGLRGYINVCKQCVSYIYIYIQYIMISPKKVESIGIDSPDPQTGRLSSQLGTESKKSKINERPQILASLTHFESF